jgi:hypothetical protein
MRLLLVSILLVSCHSAIGEELRTEGVVDMRAVTHETGRRSRPAGSERLQRCCETNSVFHDGESSWPPAYSQERLLNRATSGSM